MRLPQEDIVATFTLVSALGDGRVPGANLVEVEEADGGEVISLSDLRQLLDLPEVQQFFDAHGYGADSGVVMYLVAGEVTSGKYPT